MDEYKRELLKLSLATLVAQADAAMREWGNENYIGVSVCLNNIAKLTAICVDANTSLATNAHRAGYIDAR